MTGAVFALLPSTSHFAACLFLHSFPLFLQTAAFRLFVHSSFGGKSTLVPLNTLPLPHGKRRVSNSGQPPWVQKVPHSVK